MEALFCVGEVRERRLTVRAACKAHQRPSWEPCRRTFVHCQRRRPLGGTAGERCLPIFSICSRPLAASSARSRSRSGQGFLEEALVLLRHLRGDRLISGREGRCRTPLGHPPCCRHLQDLPSHRKGTELWGGVFWPYWLQVIRQTQGVSARPRHVVLDQSAYRSSRGTLQVPASELFLAELDPSC